MAPRLPTEPARWKEAAGYLRERVPVTRREWDEMEERTRQHAFMVSGVAEVDVVADVLRALEKRVAAGDFDFAKFKREVGAKLRAEWEGDVANPSARMRLIFQNATSRALNHGRWLGATRPEALKLRPYGRLVARLGKTCTPLCRKLHGTCLPLSHPFWKRGIPPFHHGCYTRFTTLTKAQAQEQGVSRAPPKAVPEEGFGRGPEFRWTPSRLRIHPALRTAYARRRTRK